MNNRNRMKILAIAAALSLTTGISSMAQTGPFTDIADVQGKKAIIELYDLGYVKGIGNNLYAPEQAMTTAQGMQILVNSLELNLDAIRFIKEPKATDYFNQADDAAWYAQAMIIASVHGLAFPADINPDEALTKEEFTYYLVSAIEDRYALPMIKIAPAVIADEMDMNPLYSGAIQRAIVYNVVGLDINDNFNPMQILTRAEAAMMVEQALDDLEGKQPLVEVPDNTGTGMLEHNLTATRTAEGYQLDFDISNTGEDMTLTFPSGQKFDYIVYDENGSEVYHWVIDKSFIMMLIDQPIAAGASIELSDVWNGRDNMGQELPDGKYKIAFESTFYLGETLVTLNDEVEIDYTR